MPNTSKLSKYLKAEHVKDGDIVNFMDAGTIEFREFNKDGKKETKLVLEITVEVNGEAKTYSPNATTVKILNEAWGSHTEAWAGKQGRITILPSPMGKDMIICKPV